MIQPIVEGYGDVAAVAVLLRRLRDEAGAFGVQIGSPIRRSRTQLVAEEPVRQAIRVARKQPGCQSILILFDSDNDCPRQLAPRIEAWATSEAAGIPCAVVLANREYEAWLLAAIHSLRGRGRIRPDAEPPEDAEGPRDAKGALEDRMFSHSSYHETLDQAALTAQFDFGMAFRRSRSFKRLTSAFATLLRAEGVATDNWPPIAWTNPE